VCAGIQMQKTAMLMQVIAKAVPHLSLKIVLLCSAMMAIRLMIICISNWISRTQRHRMQNKTGTLKGVRTPICAWYEPDTYVGDMIPSRRTYPMIPMARFAKISPQTM